MSARYEKKIIIIAAVVLVISVVGFISYTVWDYYTPHYQIVKSKPVNEQTDFYLESFSIGCSSNTEEPADSLKKSLEISDTCVNKHAEFVSLYTAPTHITAQCEVKNGKTIVTYSGTATNKSDGKTVDVNEQLVFDFVLTKDISQ